MAAHPRAASSGGFANAIKRTLYYQPWLAATAVIGGIGIILPSWKYLGDRNWNYDHKTMGDIRATKGLSFAVFNEGYLANRDSSFTKTTHPSLYPLVKARCKLHDLRLAIAARYWHAHQCCTNCTLRIANTHVGPQWMLKLISIGRSTQTRSLVTRTRTRTTSNVSTCTPIRCLPTAPHM